MKCQNSELMLVGPKYNHGNQIGQVTFAPDCEREATHITNGYRLCSRHTAGYVRSTGKGRTKRLVHT